MKNFWLLFFLLMTLVPIQAQRESYMGKNWLVKADVIEGSSAFFSGVSLEYVVNRRFSLTLGMKNYKHYVNQIYNDGEYLRDPGGLEISEKAEVQTNSMNIGCRIYHGNLFTLPAPDGWFNYFNLSFGQFDVNKGSYYLLLISSEEFYQVGDLVESQLVHYEYQNINFYTIEAGIGMQKLLNSYITVGGGLGLVYNRINLDNTGFTEKIISGVAKEYGSNFIHFSFLNKGESNVVRSNLGLSLTIQIGFLIF